MPMIKKASPEKAESAADFILILQRAFPVPGSAHFLWAMSGEATPQVKTG